VNLSQLRELASYLIDIHSQHELLTLKTPEFRARFVDSCADGGKQFSEFRNKYQEWSELKKKVEKLKEDLQQSAADEDYLRFQLNELEELNLSEGELISAQERLSFLENAEEINQTLSGISEALSSSENAVLDTLRSIDSELKSLSAKFENAKEWQERVHSSFVELEDLARELDNSGSDFDEDPAELKRLQERVDGILRLLTKHRKQSESELIELQNELVSQLEGIGASDEQLTLLLAELETKGAELERSATELSELRKKTADRLAPKIQAELHEMGMPDAQLSIDLNRTEITDLGQDNIEIKFTSNKGQKLQDISKAASGGELSRLMLAVKSEIAKNAKLPAIIFDEIDTGVSGDVANKVGNKIQELSERMQVFCITHLPQIASKANQHLFVFKELVDGKTLTNVRTLSSEDRIVEIAKMLSNANPTEAALTHAKNLINDK
jgi:DNA repair protein RecN (Recombination protein N)